MPAYNFDTDEGRYDFVSDTYESLRSEIIMDWEEDQRRETDIEALQTKALGRGYTEETKPSDRDHQADDSHTNPPID